MLPGLLAGAATGLVVGLLTCKRLSPAIERKIFSSTERLTDGELLSVLRVIRDQTGVQTKSEAMYLLIQARVAAAASSESIRRMPKRLPTTESSGNSTACSASVACEPNPTATAELQRCYAQRGRFPSRSTQGGFTMNRLKSAVASTFALYFAVTSSAVFAENYGPFNFDGGKISCNDDRGPEIKKSQAYEAPPDRFFVEDSISVREISGWGKAHSCSVSDVRKKEIPVNTDFGTISVKVISGFTVFAHADCGSGVSNNSGGKTASVECEVSAKLQKYTNK